MKKCGTVRPASQGRRRIGEFSAAGGPKAGWSAASQGNNMVFQARRMRPVLGMVLGLILCSSAWGLDLVTLRRDGKQMHLEGRIRVTAQDGGVLLETRDGMLWTVTPEELVSKSSNPAPFSYLGTQELARQLLATLPAGFEASTTKHYLILHNTSKAYAEWCGSLFEQLFRTFTTYWERKGFELTMPDYPLVAIVFADKKGYASYAEPDLGKAADAVIGFFNLQTNRMVMYDLTGTDTQEASGSRSGSMAQIRRLLMQPDADRLLATVIHEATHQIAFNCGLHQRLTDCPLWFSEGIAMFFERPDMSSPRTWRNIGGINASRLARLQQYLPKRPANSLRTLIQDDKRFRETAQALDAYGEAWGLTHFLIKQHPRQYVEYLRNLAKKKQLVWDTPEERVREFQAAFGSDLETLDAEFQRYVSKLR